MRSDTQFWEDGVLRPHADPGSVAVAFTHARGRGARLVLPVIEGKIRFLDASLLHLGAVMSLFGAPWPDIAAELIVCAQRSYERTMLNRHLEICVGITGDDDLAISPVIAAATFAPWSPAIIRLPPLRVALSPWTRSSRTPLAGMCTISGVERQRLRLFARSQGADEGLWLSEDRLVTEFGSRGLVWVSDYAWHLPHRELNPTWNPVIEAMLDVIRPAYAKITADELACAQAVFAVGSDGTFAAVEQVGDRHIALSPEWSGLVEGMIQDQLFNGPVQAS
jgi:branched-subunit amino acid aminotransferase/4-amino-4-deoxychorismate lyase